MSFFQETSPGALPKNEDRLLASQEAACFVVADGLSVKEGGDWAADFISRELVQFFQKNRQVLATFNELPTKEKKQKVETNFDLFLQKCCKQIFDESKKRPELAGMCTGIDLVAQLGGHAFVAHVGAGRVYLIRSGEAHLLTEDHTQLAHLRRIGKLASVSPQDQQVFSRRVTRAVGYQEAVRADYLLLELQENDRMAILSDGVWQTLGDGTTSSLLCQGENPEQLVQQLHQTVNETGPKDNFSTLVWKPDLAKVASASIGEMPSGADQKLKLLGKIPAFQFLGYQELMKVVSVGELIKVSAGKDLCREGEVGGEMMLILHGNAHVRIGGKEIGKLSTGDVFGEMSMIDSAPRSATVTAVVNTNVLAFPRKALFELFQEDSNLAVKFMWGITIEMNKRLREASNKLVGKKEAEVAQENGEMILPFVRGV